MFNYQPYLGPYQPAQQNSGIIWIQGEAAAKSYLVAPNTSVPLWDSERQTIYIKSADAAGTPSIRVLDYTIRETGQAAKEQAPAYATLEDVDGLRKQLAQLKDELDKWRRSSDE